MSENKRLRFALFGNEYQARKSAGIEQVLACLHERKAEVYIDRPFLEYLTRTLHVGLSPDGVFDDYNFDVDYAISIGGDGTFLKAANRVLAKGTPVIGVNTGRLGFLAEVLPSEFGDALTDIYEEKCELENHTVIQIAAETDGEPGSLPIEGSPYALNDIAILKRDSASMITIKAYVNDDSLVTYQADGLVVSTPTGSTAYNLSNGGPIIVPNSGSICLTPVAPHSLNIRPIVLNDTTVVRLEVESRSHNFLVAIDGRSEKLHEGTKLIIQKAPYFVKVVKLRSKRYFSILREKLMWGADQRG
jgi:NAD+ kinase